MKQLFSFRTLGIFAMTIALAFPVRIARAQEAEVVDTVGKEIVEALGKDAAEFGGDQAAQQTARRLVSEATEAAGKSGGEVAKAQVQRIIARGDEAIIFDLKIMRGDVLPLLEDVSNDALPSAVRTIVRPGVAESLESLSSTTLQKEALAMEMRLPGAGLKLIQHYGEEGAKVASQLSEDQANSLVAALRPNAVNSLPSSERSKLLNALVSRPDARLFNFGEMTGPLVVVASGVVVWHTIDVTLSPDQRVIEQPDGTVIRETTGVGSRLVQSFPQVVKELSNPLKWTGISLVVGVSVVLAVYLWLRQRRLHLGVTK
jgi:hypothetical protein